jgi:hypothetical protein
MCDACGVLGFVFFLVLGFELRAYTWSTSQPFSVKGFFEIESRNYLHGLALNLNLPDLCFLSS